MLSSSHPRDVVASLGHYIIDPVIYHERDQSAGLLIDWFIGLVGCGFEMVNLVLFCGVLSFISVPHFLYKMNRDQYRAWY